MIDAAPVEVATPRVADGTHADGTAVDAPVSAKSGGGMMLGSILFLVACVAGAAGIALMPLLLAR
jgi:hypothetical protein